ncbi:MAG: GWxTD domain-containing protein [Cytophagales bacterium]|nr:GWxTD domain-containing protein [Cytophagales bacterium]
MAYQYDPTALLRIEHGHFAENETLFLHVTVRNKTALPYALTLLTQTNMEAEEHQEISYEADTLMSGLKTAKYLIKADLGSLDKLLVLQFFNSGEVYYFPIYLNTERGETIAFQEEPAKPYLSKVPILKDTATAPYCYAYSMDFGLADPAFGNMRELSPSLEPDSLFNFGSNLSFQDWTFYFLQHDTTEAAGRGFLKCPPYYPKLRKVEELVGPVQYLSSAKEFAEIINADNPKFAFEQFWIRNAGGKGKAKTAISSFYNRVTWSNALFTNYKPGWKTDQGLIFLIYGKPDQVYKTNRKERWLYLDGQEFEFIRISTLFAPTLYTLIRKKEYRDRWIQRIGQIRKGN